MMRATPPQQPIQAPAHWGQATTYRACDLCGHGTTVEGQRMCSYRDHPNARVQLVPVLAARRQGGHCGPEAENLAFPGLHQGRF